MAALAHDPTPALPNDGLPLANQVRQGVPDAPVSVSDRPRLAPGPEALHVDPARCRTPLRALLTAAVEQGCWPELERLHDAGNRWDGPTIWGYLEANLPIAPCAMCGEPCFVINLRVRYCSDQCRRAAADLAIEGRPSPCRQPRPAPVRATPARSDARDALAGSLVPAPDARSAFLVRRDRDGREVAWYALLLATDPDGDARLLRLWHQGHWQRAAKLVTPCPGPLAARREFERVIARLVGKAGYALARDREGRVAAALRALRAGRAGGR